MTYVRELLPHMECGRIIGHGIYIPSACHDDGLDPRWAALSRARILGALRLASPRLASLDHDAVHARLPVLPGRQVGCAQHPSLPASESYCFVFWSCISVLDSRARRRQPLQSLRENRRIPRGRQAASQPPRVSGVAARVVLTTSQLVIAR